MPDAGRLSGSFRPTQWNGCRAFFPGPRRAKRRGPAGLSHHGCLVHLVSSRPHRGRGGGVVHRAVGHGHGEGRAVASALGADLFLGDGGGGRDGDGDVLAAERVVPLPRRGVQLLPGVDGLHGAPP